jgi:predicted NAD/FAD-binding protein
MTAKVTPTKLSHFPAVTLREANRRVGKHHNTVCNILSDLETLDQYSALKINLAEVGEKKADLRAALLRAAKKQTISLATSSDDKHLFVFWSIPRAKN